MPDRAERTAQHRRRRHAADDHAEPAAPDRGTAADNTDERLSLREFVRANEPLIRLSSRMLAAA